MNTSKNSPKSFNLLVFILIPIFAGIIKWQVPSYLPEGSWVFFYAAVFFSASIGGFVGGLIAIVVSVTINTYFFIPPIFSLQITDERLFFSLVSFIILSLVVSVVFEKLYRSRMKLKHLSSLQLDNTQHRLTLALSAANAGLWEWDTQTHKHEWTKSLWELYGLDPNNQAASYELWRSIIHPTDLVAAELLLKNAVENPDDFSFEWRLAAPVGGKERWLMSRGQPDYNSKGELQLFRGIVIDISDRKLIEKQLTDNEQRLNFAFETLKAGAWELNLSNKTAFRTLQHDQIFGYNTLQPKWDYGILLSHVVPEDRPIVKKCFIDAKKNHSDWNIECRICHADGSIHWISVLGRHKFDKSGYPSTISGMVQDITARKQADDLRDLQAAALEAAANAIMITDPKGVIEWVNPAFIAMTGYTSLEAIGKTPEYLVHSDKQDPSTYLDLWQAANSGRIWHGELINHRKDNSLYVEELTNTPVINGQGEVQHIISIQQDITDRKMQEEELLQHRDHLEKLVNKRTEELNEARKQAEHLSQVKSNFLANMSHEIRTPMNAVLGFSYLLEQQAISQDARNLVRKINGAGHSLLAIINDILDFSKIEAGGLEVEKVPFLLLDLLDHLAALMSALANNKDLELNIVPPIDINSLIGDSLRIQQVLVNLLSNAIKFTDQGGVELRVTIEAEQNEQIKLRFVVKDSGIGISLDQQKDLFSAFTQADSSINRRFGGTGLGLTISQKLVNLMGGELQLDSTIGEGSEFSFTLQLQRNTELERTPSKLANLNILIVDDSSIAREALLMTVRSLGWHADAVESGPSAIMHIQERLNSQRLYDLVLLDWKMPGLDGLETAEAIRQVMSNKKNHPNYSPIILLVSAYSQEALKLLPGISHIDALLSKPISPSTLYNTVAGLLKNSGITVLEAPIKISSQKIPGVKVLVVDDSEINREVVQRILEAEGALVSTANDGEEALQWLSKHPHNVDIVLMDIQMPLMDGYVATQKIRQNPDFAELPVIALTAGAFKSLEDDALAAGMNDFIAKPFNVPELMTLIQRWTGCASTLFNVTEQTAGRLDIEFQPDKNQVAQTLADEATRNLPGIDIETGLKTWGQVDVYQKYLSRFIDEYHEAGQNIVNEDQDVLDTAKSLVHKLKGAAYSLALTTVAARCIDVETAITAGKSVTGTAKALQIAITEVSASLAAWLAVAPPLEKNIPANTDSNNTDEIIQLTNQLLAALSINNPGLAESLLIILEVRLGTDLIIPIKAQIDDFNFREAEVLTRLLIQQIK
ncbi:response regulator [Methylobacter psychrophilus]|uniref:response regulator n=1 Tax=Methylobacter psychrophilus TaxID=96941 RepID=UPI0021D4A109|nr:response regulator [Methylobacter psychrophilus]